MQEDKYKKTVIGKLPSHWEITSLGAFGDFTNGINKHKNDFGYGVPFVNLQDVFGVNSINKIPEGRVNSSNSELNRYSLHTGDVLFVRSSVKPEGVGLTAVVINNLDDVVFSGFLIRFRQKITKLISEFSKYCFYENGFRRRLLACSTISANTNINQNALNKLIIAIPPKEEQIIIANILSSWDAAIETYISLIQKKIELKHAFMQQFLTGKLRFTEFKIRQFHKKELGAFLIPTLRPVPRPSSSYIALGIRSHGKGTFLRNVEDPETVMMDTLYEVKENDLIVNITFAWEGAIAIVKKSDEGALVSHRFPTYTFNREVVIPEYFKHVIQTKRFVHELGLVSPGGAGRNRVLSKKDFLNIVVSVPSVDEQTKIAKVLDGHDKEIELLKQYLEYLNIQKKGLMQKLLTGQIRVKI